MSESFMFPCSQYLIRGRMEWKIDVWRVRLVLTLFILIFIFSFIYLVRHMDSLMWHVGSVVVAHGP